MKQEIENFINMLKQELDKSTHKIFSEMSVAQEKYWKSRAETLTSVIIELNDIVKKHTNLKEEA